MNTDINNNSDEIYDSTLRPKFFREYIGQERVKQNLQIMIDSALKRNDYPDHILLYGPPGLGKTTLAQIIAVEFGAPIVTTSGPAIERSGDLAAILTGLESGSILFIDEIHRIPRSVEEILYPAMEERVIDLTVGKGPGAKTLRLDIEPFVLIGATTKIGSLSSPFRDRFGSILQLEFYSHQEISQILARSASILNIQIAKDCLLYLAERSRMTPRIANRLLKRVRDIATINDSDQIDMAIIQESLKILDIDQNGLDTADRRFLSSIVEKFHGGPVGLKNIAAVLSEDPTNIEEVIEPYLLRSGLVKRTSQGRVVTKKGYELLGIKVSEDSLLL